jgi:hypothetical protein
LTVATPSELAARPGHVLPVPQRPQHRVLLGEQLPLVVDLEAEQRELRRLVALADREFEAAPRQLIDRRVVFRDPHGVEDRDDRDSGVQSDPVRPRGDRAEKHGRRRREEVPRVALPDGDRVEAELLRPHRRAQGLFQPVGG